MSWYFIIHVVTHATLITISLNKVDLYDVQLCKIICTRKKTGILFLCCTLTSLYPKLQNFAWLPLKVSLTLLSVYHLENCPDDYPDHFVSRFL